ncbi:AraC family transcriptional regulator [Streptomyces sp. RerS4]|uniref:helix-turn-helix domain-containing protein n=1 Tax=Streptomyces sp. RerS4 TaxID=2942449 RepID=UPI00201B9A6D|nr:AraC family transcriptional regulator [Streptomyces sp. RerS4]UQW99639.1 AraC family transcriptional regulator [Streptomyces sp. RerS4]
MPTGRAVLVTSLGEPFARVRRLGESSTTGQVTGSLVAGLEDGPRVCDHPGGQEAIRIERGPVPAPEVSHAWRLPARSGGAIPVGRIAPEVGWSQGHLVRRFTAQTGLTPKTSARVLRFHRAVGLLTREGSNPTEVTAACGFHDRAHLNREFRALRPSPW